MDKQLLSTPKSFRLLKVLAETERSSIFKALWEDSSGEFCDQCVLKVLKSKKLVSECVDDFCSLKTVQSPYCVRVYS